MIFWPVLRSLIALVLICQIATVQDTKTELTVAIVINKSDYENLKGSIDQYVADVTKKWPGVRFEVLSDRDWKSPLEIRESLTQLYKTAKPKLEGAILVGQLPFMKFKTKLLTEYYDDKKRGNVAVCPMYFQDLDGEFDTPKNGILQVENCRQGKNPGAEIWVSFIYPSSSDNAKGIEQIKKFFDKTHRYYTGKQKYNGRVLLWQTLSVDPTNADVKELVKVFSKEEIDYYGKDETYKDPTTKLLCLKKIDLTKIGTLTKENNPVPGWKYQGDRNPLVKQLAKVSGALYDLYEVHYGGGYFHAYLSTDDVKGQKSSPKIVCMNACRTGQFDYDPTRSIALAYIFDTDGTLAAMGPTVEANWSQLYNMVYRFMGEGDYLGRAWLRKDQITTLPTTDVVPTEKPGKTNFHDHTIPDHGSTLVGDPFVRLRD